MFGTDGVRGVAGSELTIELATQLGQAGAYVLTKEQEHQPTIIVGCDTRISGGMLASALMAGICLWAQMRYMWAWSRHRRSRISQENTRWMPEL